MSNKAIDNPSQGRPSPSLLAEGRGLAREALHMDRAGLVGTCVTAFVIIIPLLVLIGWAFDIPRLKRIFPGLIEMNPVTALLFICSAVTLSIQRLPQARRELRWLARALAIVVVVTAGLVLQWYFTQWDSQIDRYLFRAELGRNRVAPNTAACFILSGFALLILRRETRNGFRPAQILAIAVWAGAMLALLGYAYSTRSFYHVRSFIPMSLHTAVCFLLLSVGILCAYPDRGAMSLMMNSGAGGSLIRSLMPAVIIVPAVLGYLALLVERYHWVDVETSLSLFAVLVMVIFSLLVWANGNLLRRSDARRRTAEGALSQERNLLRKLIDNLPDHIYIKDAQGHYITDNTSHAHFLGAQSPEQVIGKTVRDYFPPEMADRFVADDNEVLQSGQPIIGREEAIIDRQGNRGWVATTKVPLLDSAGKIAGVVCISRDISLRKRIEREMQEIQDFLSSIIENIPNMVFVKDAKDLRFVRFNRAGEDLLGVKREDIIGKNDHDLFPSDEADFFNAKDRAVLESGKMLDIAIEPIDTKDGQRLLHTKKIPIILDGEPKYLLGISEDITERIQADEAMRESEERTRMTVETALDAFVSMDARGNVLGWNSQSEKQFGWTAAEVMGKPLADLIIPHRYREAHWSGLDRFLKTGEGPVLNQRIELVALHRDGHEFPVELTISPLRVRGNITFNAFIHDISTRKRIQQELEQTARSEREAHQKLKQAQSAMVQTEKLASLGQLVAGVAHEINNPLSFVSNNVAVLQRDIAAIRQVLALYQKADPQLESASPEVIKEVREVAERVDLPYTLSNLDEMMVRSRDGLKRIQQIVKDLRDFARLDSSDLQDADLNAGIESTINILRGQAKSKKVNIVLELRPLPPVACYPAKINQVIMNLVSNAMDASQQGTDVKVHSKVLDGSHVEVSVTDSGTGIPPHVKDRIFDPFFTTKKQGEGTGLGLSISYGIVRDHGGMISVESEVGKGSTFRIKLPVQQPEKLK